MEEQEEIKSSSEGDFVTWKQGEELSNERLIMEQMRRVMEAGSQDMTKGWVERRVDKFGDTFIYKIHSDTRLKFGECVLTLKNKMIKYIRQHPKYETKINQLFQELTSLKIKFQVLEQLEWEKISANVKKDIPSKWLNRWEHIDGQLNFDYIFGETFLQESVEIYRKIFEEIESLLNDLDYLKTKPYKEEE